MLKKNTPPRGVKEARSHLSYALILYDMMSNMLEEAKIEEKPRDRYYNFSGRMRQWRKERGYISAYEECFGSILGPPHKVLYFLAELARVMSQRFTSLNRDCFFAPGEMKIPMFTNLIDRLANNDITLIHLDLRAMPILDPTGFEWGSKKLNFRDMEKLKVALAGNIRLTDLNLEMNMLGAAGAMHLAAALALNGSIKHLHCGWNALGAEGAGYIADALMDRDPRLIVADILEESARIRDKGIYLHVFKIPNILTDPNRYPLPYFGRHHDGGGGEASRSLAQPSQTGGPCS